MRRIFAEFIVGYGVFAIAERLTAGEVASPPAHDPGRNRHRCGLAWSRSAARAILMSPRHTGCQVWNRQRKDEVLIDVANVALGHTAKMRWNDEDKWIFPDEIVHHAVIDAGTFQSGPAPARGQERSQDSPPPTVHPEAVHPARATVLRDLPPADAEQLEQ